MDQLILLISTIVGTLIIAVIFIFIIKKGGLGSIMATVTFLISSFFAFLFFVLGGTKNEIGLLKIVLFFTLSGYVLGFVIERYGHKKIF